jgi:hypothetical protein
MVSDPLPFCEAAGLPYWRINIRWCLADAAWLAWQSGRPMAEIIPRIDERLSCST